MHYNLRARRYDVIMIQYTSAISYDATVNSLPLLQGRRNDVQAATQHCIYCHWSQQP